MVFLVFMFMGSLDVIRLNIGEVEALLLNSFLSIAFFIQHSGMVRKSFKRRSTSLISENHSGVVFSIASSLLLLLLMVFWQKSNFMIASAHGDLRWLLRLIFGLALLGFLWGARSLGSLNTFGTERMRRKVKGTATKPTRLLIRGPYRWIRHPLYLFCIVMIWSCPDLTADRLLFNVMWTIWIIVGIVLEERDLVSQFGSSYLDYRKNVPMLIPNRAPLSRK
jgi:protein-S-isoprenylcysteine O-methyltransferase Ste14